MIQQLIQNIVAMPDFWQQIGDFSAPRFNPGSASSYRRIWWTSVGRILGLYIFYYGQGPVPVSPFLILALFSGRPNSLLLSHAWIESLDPALASMLRPWLLLSSEDPLPEPFSPEVRDTLINHGDIDVS